MSDLPLYTVRKKTIHLISDKTGVYMWLSILSAIVSLSACIATVYFTFFK